MRRERRTLTAARPERRGARRIEAGGPDRTASPLGEHSPGWRPVAGGRERRILPDPDYAPPEPW